MGQIQATVMHIGWETDNLAWLSRDNNLLTTDCNAVVDMSVKELEDKIAETRDSLRELEQLRTVWLETQA